MALRSTHRRWHPSAAVLRYCSSAVAVLLLFAAAGTLPAQSPAEFFEKQVRPLLAEHCFECHGPKAEDPGGNLRISGRKALLAGGDSGPAIVPGKPDQSLLLEAVTHSDRFEMPPDRKLQPREIDVLRRWIQQGAYWPPADVSRPGTGAESDSRSSKTFSVARRRAEHWCWQPIGRPEPPSVQQATWPANPIDRFILARLEAEGLSPAPPADRVTLIRRLTFDLTGLPPTPQEIDAFLADRRPDATDRLIDRLLASPTFGEKWARHWLDLARYAETFGHEFDFPIAQAWRYRDYVIRVWNDDVPYDQFVREQIAGDLLPEPRIDPATGTNESITGTMFWLLGEAVHAPVDVRRDQANRVDNQIDVFGKTFLGLTIACARCHDHKFDAISSRDYYALFGVLESAHRGETFRDPRGRWRRAATEAANRARQASVKAVDVLQHVDAERLTQQFASNLLEALTDRAERPLWSDPHLVDDEHPVHVLAELHRRLEKDPAGKLIAEGRHLVLKARQRAETAEREGHYALLFDFGGEKNPQGFTTGWAFEDDTSSSSRPRLRIDIDGTFFGTVVPPGILDSRRLGRRMRGVWRSSSFTLEHPYLFYRLAGENAEVRLIIDGYTMVEFQTLLFRETKFSVQNGRHWYWHRQAGDLKKYLGHLAHIEIRDTGDGWVVVDRIVGSTHAEPPPIDSPLAMRIWSSLEGDTLESLVEAYAQAWRAALQAAIEGRLTPQQTALWNWSIRHQLVDLEELANLCASSQQETATTTRHLPAPTLVPALVEGSPVDERLFIRGNPRNLGPVVPRGLLEALTLPGGKRAVTRLEIAEAVAHPDNPLTARVIVNRLWHHLFGRGLVRTVDNFGVLGEAPTHPDLLDYLARDLIEHRWSLKHTIRLIVSSRTYQMSSRTRPIEDRKDPANLWYHRMAVRRLPAESIRDALLAASGRLVEQVGGPSVPAYLSPHAQGRGRPSSSGPLDGAGRRTLYLEVRRNFLHPFWLAFDGPIPFTTIGRRNVSNVPAQGLAMMNDPFVWQQAEGMAARLLAERPDDADVSGRVAWITWHLLGRPPTPQESQDVVRFLEVQRRLYEQHSKEIGERRLWGDVCHALMNAKEFLFLR